MRRLDRRTLTQINRGASGPRRVASREVTGWIERKLAVVIAT
jgi:hypothetical protein